MTEGKAIKLVQKHARYHKDMPGGPCYVLRWPPTNPKALIENSPRELVEKLLARENKEKE